MATKLDEFHYHEVLDRTFVIQCTIEEHLEGHIVIKENKNLSKKLEKAQELLSEVYQECGALQEKL